MGMPQAEPAVDAAAEGGAPAAEDAPKVKRGKLQTPPAGRRYVVSALSGAVVRRSMSIKSKVVGRLADRETIVCSGDAILESASGANRIRTVYERRAARAAAVAALPVAASFSQFADRRRPPPPAGDDGRDVRLRASDVVNRCGAVLGYRACAAVPALVEFAVAHKKPFCVLPCCCYDVGETRCASTAQMVDVLAELHPAIRKTEVHGAGTVLYATFGRPWR